MVIQLPLERIVSIKGLAYSLASWNDSFYRGDEGEIATLGEQIAIIEWACSNQSNPDAKYIANMFNTHAFAGDTSIRYAKRKIFVSDNPLTINPSEYRDSQGVRVLDYPLDNNPLTPDQIRKNKLLVGLTGDEESPEKLAQILQPTGREAIIWIPTYHERPPIRVPFISLGTKGLVINCLEKRPPKRARCLVRLCQSVS
ncbi:MAG: hypothetical protein AABW89_04955 [Nanoarchaeota archaeon]